MKKIQLYTKVLRQGTESGCGQQMMIVGCDSDLRDVITYALISYGFRLNFFNSGLEALANVVIQPLDGIIIDCDLAGIEGVELIRRFRGQFPMAIIISMSEEDKGAAFLQAGANDFLQKPFVPYRLAMMLDGGDILS
jgi:DNA-binding response OmpR family regulator